ncbi:MAG: ATP-dependent helicase HrpB [Blastocatellia bacterium]|nr:ATP-dependent helicase HrpB [Blastocatellia bacterium]
MQSLPIDSILPEIIKQLNRTPSLVLEAPPGAGKTTRVPSALLDAGVAGDGEVWVLEPRRLAARLAARRVAEERGERLGDTIGYQVRFEEIAGPRTRLRFLTEGVLTRRLLGNPLLANVGLVVIDEFHERHLQADLALALLRRLREGERRDLKLVVMSATLAAAPIAAFLGNAPVLRSEGKRFEVAIEYLSRPDDRPLAEQVESAVRRLLAEALDGDILVFLPGAAEIRRAQAACAAVAGRHNTSILPLHGDLPAAEQDRAVRPASQRKLILATNVAESSVTIEGVAAVVDSGLARIAGHSPWSGLPTLNVGRISKASAEQRAGRAGRTRPGRCLRLYTAQDYHARPDHETAEIHRLDLAETALELHAAGIGDVRTFAWFEAPPESALEAAESLLSRLGAIDDRGEVTPTGRGMLRFPLHPRQSRLLVEAHDRGAGEKAAIIAALIGERDLIATNLFKGEFKGVRRGDQTAGPSDLLDRLDLFENAARANFSRLEGLDYGAVLSVEKVRKQLERLAGKGGAPAPLEELEQRLLISILAGYPDRVARRRSLKTDNVEVLLSNGGSAALSTASTVRQSEFLVAVDAEERRESGKIVRLASAIEPEWLIDLFPDQLRETTEARWNAESERVEVVKRLLYDRLVIDESRTNEGNEVAEVLAEAALSAGLQRFVDPDSVEKFIARIDFVAQTFPDAGLPAFDDSDVREALIALCAGLNSFAQLRQATGKGGLLEVLRQKLNPEQARLVDRMAPEQVAIAGRRQVRVNYEQGKPPWIASRLQDFFGMTEGPLIAGGRIPLVLHLLAPNQRPVQVTTDLAGFWLRTYPQVRRELSRKYPRHAWPENPK